MRKSCVYFLGVDVIVNLKNCPPYPSKLRFMSSSAKMVAVPSFDLTVSYARLTQD